MEEVNPQILTEISEIATQYRNAQKKYTREELSIHLSKMFPEEEIMDSSNLTTWVKLSFQNTRQSTLLYSLFLNCFTSNDGMQPLFTKETVVSNLRVLNNSDEIILEQNQLFKDSEKINTQLSLLKSNDSVQMMRELLADIGKDEKGGGLLDWASGASKVLSVQKTGEKIYSKYQELIRIYENEKSTVESCITQFTNHRRNLHFKYQDVLNALILVFGDKIRSTEPEIFDFSEIDYLESEKFKEAIKNHFEDIDSECKLFINQHRLQLNSSIINSAKTNLDSLSKNLEKLNKNKSLTKNQGKAALATAGVSFLIDTTSAVLESRNEASNKAELLKLEIENMRTLFMDDKELFQRDLLRLIEITNTVGDVFMGDINRFITEFFKYLREGVWDSILEVINKPEILILKTEVNKIIEGIRAAHIGIVDNLESLKLKEVNLIGLEKELEQNTPIYEKCLVNEPQKPNSILTILSLGLSGTIFNSFYSLWKHASEQTIMKQKRLWKEINQNKTTQESLKQQKDANEALITKFKLRKKDLEHTIVEAASVYTNEIATIKAHLPMLSKALKAAKRNIELSLDIELIKTSQN